jgi:hypothetical protein
MAREAEHIALANRNHAALIHLLNDGQFLDWAATVAFYKAVHIAEAVLAANIGHHSNSHTERERALKMARFAPIFRDYSHLFSASRVARYLIAPAGQPFSTFADFMDANAVKKLVRVRLYGVEQASLGFLSNPSKTSLLKIDPGSML